MNRLFTFIATALIFCAGNQTKVKSRNYGQRDKISTGLGQNLS